MTSATLAPLPVPLRSTSGQPWLRRQFYTYNQCGPLGGGRSRGGGHFNETLVSFTADYRIVLAARWHNYITVSSHPKPGEKTSAEIAGKLDVVAASKINHDIR